MLSSAISAFKRAANRRVTRQHTSPSILELKWTLYMKKFLFNHCMARVDLVRVSPPRRQQLSRQEIETCLVKRARRSIHASFWLFHQPARNVIDFGRGAARRVQLQRLHSLSRSLTARGDGVDDRCAYLPRAARVWLQLQRCSVTG